MSFIYNLDPILLSLGPIEIRYYGLVYLLGGIFIFYYLDKYKKELNLTKDGIYDLTLYLIFGIIIGSRLFEVFVWEPSYYLSNPIEILKIWKGGMSFHGGLVGIITALYIFARRYKADFWKIADILSIPAAFTLALGRIANFINGELWGRPWNGLWCVNFKNSGGGDICRHPSQLYASAKRFIVFGILILLNKREHRPGFIFWSFILLEGLGRIAVDFFREDILYFGLSTGQWLSVIMVAAALYFLYDIKKDHYWMNGSSR